MDQLYSNNTLPQFFEWNLRNTKVLNPQLSCQGSRFDPHLNQAKCCIGNTINHGEDGSHYWYWDCFNIAYPTENNLKLKSHEILFINDTHLSHPIVLFANFPNDWATKKWWTSEFLWDLSSLLVSEGFPMLQQPLSIPTLRHPKSQ